MPRSLTLGNGNILVGIDQRASVRDFYFPHVGLENHIGDYRLHRIGVWVDGSLHWLSDGGWRIEVGSDKESFLGITTARNESIGISLRLYDVVYNEKNVFIREVAVKNEWSDKRMIKLYFSQQFQISGSSKGDTAYFDPIYRAIIHYKGRRVFLVNATTKGAQFDDYSVGVFGMEGKEGTFRDSEDGRLSENPIEHGQVDSVLGLTLFLDGGSERIAHYWVAVAETIKEVFDMNRFVMDKTPSHMIRTTADYWKAWAHKYNFEFIGLSEDIIAMFKKSLFIIRTHVDNKGAIIASSDSDMFQHGKDTYAYMWPRDASFAAMALDHAGDFNVSRRFFEFCDKVISDDGYFMHKYRPDYSLGSSWHPWVRDGVTQLPIQEDETAIVLVALWKHYELSRDLEFVESVYNSLIKKSAFFLAGYRDASTGLPKPSYDLWEERYGIHTYTASSVYAGLISAAKFAEVLGKKTSKNNFENAAEELRRSIMTHLYDSSSGTFYRSIISQQNGTVEVDKTPDMSSVYGAFIFGVLEPADKKLKKAFEKTSEILSCDSHIGGLSRYAGDKYFHTGTCAGNPWFVTTLWLAEYYAAVAKNERDLSKTREILSWAHKYSLGSGIMAEQLNAVTGESVSATPLVWSHAAFVSAVVRYLNKLEELGICAGCNPVG